MIFSEISQKCNGLLDIRAGSPPSESMGTLTTAPATGKVALPRKVFSRKKEGGSGEVLVPEAQADPQTDAARTWSTAQGPAESKTRNNFPASLSEPGRASEWGERAGSARLSRVSRDSRGLAL